MSRKWTKNSKYDIPDNFGWEFHNPDAAHQAREAQARGDTGAWDNYRNEYIESQGQREERWRALWLKKEKFEKNIKDFQAFKENPDEYVRTMSKMGRFLSKFWYTVPKKTFGQGKLQQRIDGGWRQEYKPSKSMRMQAWLQASEHGEVFTGQINQKRKPIGNAPTDEEMDIATQAASERQWKWWNKIFDVTNNFGRGDSKPRIKPGAGGGEDKIVLKNKP